MIEMDEVEIDSDSGDTVNGVDRFLVSAGVLALGLLPAYGLLVAKPEKYASKLIPKQSSDTLPGPGLFFIGSILFVLLAVSVASAGMAPPDEKIVQTAQESNSAFAIGTAIGHLMNSLEDRLFSGDFWSAVAVSVPIFSFAVLLAVPLRLLLGWAVKNWTSSHAMGAALYITGGALIGIGLSASIGLITGRMFGRVIGTLIAMLGIFAAIALTGVQAHAFGNSAGPKSDVRLGLSAAAVPFSIIGIFVALAAVANFFY